MAFKTNVVWTQQGKHSWAAFLNNQHVLDPNAAFRAVNDCIQGFGAMKLSQSNPETSSYGRDGYGRISWTDGNVQRVVNINFSFQPSNWVETKTVTLNVIAIW